MDFLPSRRLLQWATVCFLLLAMVSVSACAPSQTTPEIEVEQTEPVRVEPTEAEEPTGQTPEPTKQGGTLRIAWGIDLDVFDPPQAVRALEGAATSHVFQGLTRINPDTGVPEPLLSTGWKVSDDGLTWNFELREDVEFQDGSKFNADAVVSNVKRWIDPDFPHGARAYIADIVDASAIDEYTVEFQLSKPNPILAGSLATRHQLLVSPLAIEEYGVELGLHLPAGTGPFKLVEFIPRQKIVMERWEGYWGTEEIFFDDIVWDTILDSSTRTSRLLAGEADLNVYQSELDVPRIEEDPSVDLISGPSPRQWHIYINLTKPQLADINVRKALNYAIDQNALVEVGLQGFGEVRYSMIGFGHLGATEANPHYEYDPEKAIELLEEAGWTMGDDGLMRDSEGNLFEIRYDYTTGGEYAGDDAIADAFAGMLGAIGISVNVVGSDGTTFFATTALDESAPQLVDLAALPVAVGQLDGAHFMRLIYSETALAPNCCNWSSYSNEEGWEAIAAALAEADIDKRVQLIEEAQQILWEDVPCILGPQTFWILGKSAKLQGITLAPTEAHPFGLGWFEE